MAQLAATQPVTALRPHTPPLIAATEIGKKPRVRAVGLEKLLRQVEAGELEVSPLLLPPSETAEVLNVPRRTLSEIKVP